MAPGISTSVTTARMSGLGLGQPQGLVPVRLLKHAAARLVEHVGVEHAHERLVLGEESDGAGFGG